MMSNWKFFWAILVFTILKANNKKLMTPSLIIIIIIIMMMIKTMTTTAAPVLLSFKQFYGPNMQLSVHLTSWSPHSWWIQKCFTLFTCYTHTAADPTPSIGYILNTSLTSS
jgi:hypothetical protein